MNAEAPQDSIQPIVCITEGLAGLLLKNVNKILHLLRHFFVPELEQPFLTCSLSRSVLVVYHWLSDHANK